MEAATSRRAGGTETEPGDARKTIFYGGIVGVIVAIDALTKRMVQNNLPLYEPVPVWGDFFRLTYIYNRGAAFGLHLGDYSRLIFLVLTIVVVGVLLSWFRTTPISDRLRLTAIAIVLAGALGNFIDRARSPRGVVDFLDFGMGNIRWPVFNVADIAVMTGALLLGISLWREEREAEREHG